MIHSKVSTITSTAGSTVGTFDAINTLNGDNTLPSGTTKLVGVAFVYAENALTAAKTLQTRIRVNCPSAGMNNEDFLSGWLLSQGIATNDSGGVHQAEFIPIQRTAMPGGSLSTVAVNFFLSQAGASSGNTLSAVASPVSFTPTTGPDAPSDWYAGYLSWPGRALPAMGSQSSNGTTGGTAANENKSLTSFKIRGEYLAVSGVMLTQAAAAVGAAGDECVAWGDFGSPNTNLSGVQPQQWPFNSTEPALGTPVGSPVQGRAWPLPVWMPKGTGEITMDVLENVLTATTATESFAVSVDLRK